jgi:hypothetical protein
MDKITIEQTIVDYRVESAEAKAEVGRAERAPVLATSADGKVVRMHEKLERPEGVDL